MHALSWPLWFYTKCMWMIIQYMSVLNMRVCMRHTTSTHRMNIHFCDYLLLPLCMPVTCWYRNIEANLQATVLTLRIFHPKTFLSRPQISENSATSAFLCMWVVHGTPARPQANESQAGMAWAAVIFFPLYTCLGIFMMDLIGEN